MIRKTRNSRDSRGLKQSPLVPHPLTHHSSIGPSLFLALLFYFHFLSPNHFFFLGFPLSICLLSKFIQQLPAPHTTFLISPLQLSYFSFVLYTFPFFLPFTLFHNRLTQSNSLPSLIILIPFPIKTLLLPHITLFYSPTFPYLFPIFPNSFIYLLPPYNTLLAFFSSFHFLSF